MSPTVTIARKELRDAARSRWLLGFGATFGLMALLLSVTQSQGGVGQQAFTRTTASLINLCLLLVPLVALVLGAGAIAGERERGTLATLLAQPVSSTELLIGKFAGLLLALWAAVALGFGVAGVLIALLYPVSGAGGYLLFVLLAAGLATTMLSVGMLVSVWSQARTQAVAVGIVLWFVFVLFYDLAVIGLVIALSSSGEALVVAVLGNPVEAARILAVVALDPDLRVLGPMGSYLVTEVGTAPTVTLLVASLVIWTAFPLLLAARGFANQDY